MKTGKNKLPKLLLCAAASLLLILMFSFTVMAAGTQTVTLQKGSNGYYQYQGMLPDYNTTVYHKITVPKDGALVVGGASIYVYSQSTGSMSVVLYNSKFKNIDRSNYGNTIDTDLENPKNSLVACYAVKKGTYYIKTSNVKNYVLSIKLQSWKDKGGSSKKKATTIKQNKSVKGALQAGEKSSKADWYKFKVTKRKKLYLDVESLGTGSIQVYLYGPGFPSRGFVQTIYPNESKRIKIVNMATQKAIKVRTGTYYVKVVRGAKNISDIYSLKWRLK